MRVRLLYFGGVQEKVGRSAETLELAPGVATIAALREQLALRGGPWSAFEADRRLRFAVNRAVVSGQEAQVSDGDEVAVFPPVTGG